MYQQNMNIYLKVNSIMNIYSECFIAIGILFIVNTVQHIANDVYI